MALPTPNVDKELGRSYSTNLVSVLSPSMTNEAVVSYTRLTLDNSWKDPSLVAQGTNPGGVSFNGIQFPYPTAPELPTQLLHGWGGNGQVGQPLVRRAERVRPQRLAAVQRQADQADGRARAEVRPQASSAGRSSRTSRTTSPASSAFDARQHLGTGNSAADMLDGPSVSSTQGTALKGKPLPGMPYGEFRYWDVDAFAQDSWKLKPNFTLEYGVRFGKWTNNEERSRHGGYFTRSLYDPTRVRSSTRARTSC